MEERLIDAKKAMDSINEIVCTLSVCIDYCNGMRAMKDIALHAIEEQPTVDAVPVVRCKDCIHWSNDSIGYCKYHEIYPSRHDLDDWFCADGERRE